MQHATVVRSEAKIARICAAADLDPAVLDYWVESTRGVGAVVTIETGDADPLAVWQRIVEAASLLA